MYYLRNALRGRLPRLHATDMLQLGGDVVLSAGGSTQGTVTIGIGNINGIPTGATIIYTGACSDAGTAWSVSGGGSFPTKYLPKM